MFIINGEVNKMPRLRKDGKPAGTLDKKPKNRVEGMCYDLLHSLGWTTVTKRGMPDFMCLKKNGEFMLVECKPEKRGLSKPQFILFNKLSKHGIPCYYYSPSAGLQKFVNFKRSKWS